MQDTWDILHQSSIHFCPIGMGSVKKLRRAKSVCRVCVSVSTTCCVVLCCVCGSAYQMWSLTSPAPASYRLSALKPSSITNKSVSTFLPHTTDMGITTIECKWKCRNVCITYGGNDISCHLFYLPQELHWQLHFLNNLTRSTKLIETHLEIYEDECKDTQFRFIVDFFLCALQNWFYGDIRQRCLFFITADMFPVISIVLAHILQQLAQCLELVLSSVHSHKDDVSLFKWAAPCCYLWNLLLSIHSNYSINATALCYIITHRKPKQWKWSQLVKRFSVP